MSLFCGRVLATSPVVGIVRAADHRASGSISPRLVDIRPPVASLYILCSAVNSFRVCCAEAVSEAEVCLVGLGQGAC